MHLRHWAPTRKRFCSSVWAWRGATSTLCGPRASFDATSCRNLAGAQLCPQSQGEIRSQCQHGRPPRWRTTTLTNSGRCTTPRLQRRPIDRGTARTRTSKPPCRARCRTVGSRTSAACCAACRSRTRRRDTPASSSPNEASPPTPATRWPGWRHQHRREQRAPSRRNSRPATGCTTGHPGRTARRRRLGQRHHEFDHCVWRRGSPRRHRGN